MAQKLIRIKYDESSVNEKIHDGDQIVIIDSNLRSLKDFSLAVFPQTGATAVVEFTHAPSYMIAANPDDADIQKFAWQLGPLDETSPRKDDTFQSRVQGIYITAVGGEVIAQGTL